MLCKTEERQEEEFLLPRMFTHRVSSRPRPIIYLEDIRGIGKLKSSFSPGLCLYIDYPNKIHSLSHTVWHVSGWAQRGLPGAAESRVNSGLSNLWYPLLHNLALSSLQKIPPHFLWPVLPLFLNEEGLRALNPCDYVILLYSHRSQATIAFLFMFVIFSVEIVSLIKREMK